MTTLKQLDDLITSAGLENVSSFVHNLMMVFAQEYGALKSCAEEDAGAVVQCECGAYLVAGISGRLVVHWNATTDNRRWLMFHYICPACKKPVSVQVVPFGLAEEVELFEEDKNEGV